MLSYRILLSSLVALYAFSGCAPMSMENTQPAMEAKKDSNTTLPQCYGTPTTVPYANYSDSSINGNPNNLTTCRNIRISVIGQGVAPVNTTSPAQAYALAKRAAVTDGYRNIAEKISGVQVEGHDTIKNMMVIRSEVRTQVNSVIRNANIAETTFKEGLCEVEMEIILSYGNFVL